MPGLSGRYHLPLVQEEELQPVCLPEAQEGRRFGSYPLMHLQRR